MKLHRILLGAPGSGKGTLANKLANLGLIHVSTGDLLRKEISKKSELGKLIGPILISGGLVDDQTMIRLIKANCDTTNNSLIFDGFPRTLEQAKKLDEYIIGKDSAQAIYFKIDVENIVSRITNRRIALKSGEIYNLLTRQPKVEGKCDISGEDLIQRPDDNEDVIRNRIKNFNAEIEPILSYYRDTSRLVVVDANLNPEAIFEIIRSVL